MGRLSCFLSRDHFRVDSHITVHSVAFPWLIFSKVDFLSRLVDHAQDLVVSHSPICSFLHVVLAFVSLELHVFTLLRRRGGLRDEAELLQLVVLRILICVLLLHHVHRHFKWVLTLALFLTVGSPLELQIVAGVEVHLVLAVTITSVAVTSLF